jgi:hypothetical protein
MSFNLKYDRPLINGRLTEIGRQKLASGKLNFSYLVYGDSQIDYQNTGIGVHILKPVDKNPYVKTQITKEDCNPFNPINLKITECVVSNCTEEKGFFDVINYDLNIDNPAIDLSGYIKESGYIDSSQLNGSKQLSIDIPKAETGDILVLVLYTVKSGYENVGTVEKPVPYLSFKINKIPATTLVELDRNLPNLNHYKNSVAINYYVYSNDINYYSSSNAQVVWNYNTASFEKECLIESTKVWNMNIIWGENPIGIVPPKYGYEKFDSFDYIGQKEYLGYNLYCPEILTSSTCEDKLSGKKDNVYKNIALLHFTNENKSNEYGEKFIISESRPFIIKMPTLMWHRRYFSGSLADDIGMNFIADYTQKLFVENTNIEYYNLIEDPSFLAQDVTPMVVGRVYPQLKVVTFHESELVAATTLKSNRNFTLPSIKGQMIAPDGIGVLPRNKKMYVTYTFRSTQGINEILPMQNYLVFENNTLTAKDISFTIEDINQLKYMRKEESISNDGYGFYFKNIYLLYQITDIDERPDSSKWKQFNLTNIYLTDFTNQTINPAKLENQNPTALGFNLNKAKDDISSDYILAVQLPDDSCPDVMNFGYENIFFGNIKACIGASIFKTIIETMIDANLFIRTTNPTHKTQDLAISDIGIYDSEYDMVWYNSLSMPIILKDNTKNLIEIQMDF